jgi:hypothetical protein
MRHQKPKEAANLIAVFRARRAIRILIRKTGIHGSIAHKSNLHRLCRNGESCKAMGAKKHMNQSEPPASS